MFTRVALVTTLAVTAGAAKTLKLTWSDCGDASTHAKVTSLSTDHIVTGTPSPVTGTGTVDEDVAGGSYAIDLAAGIIKEHWTGDICEPKTFQMPLAAGSIKWLGMKCPQAKGTATVGTEIDLSSLLPSFLTHANIKITATDKAGNKLLCFSVATAPETELVDEAAAQLVTASSGACAADDQSFIQGHPGTGGDSFGQMGHDCGYQAYSIFSGFDENTFKTCIEGKGIKSDSCAGCFADIAKYGADNCKMACISNWCSKGCLDCAHTPSTKSTLNACAGFPTPEVAPCDGGDDTEVTAPETELGACAADDQSFIQGHPGTGGDSFGQMGHDCGYQAYSIFSGFDENTFKTCIEGKGIKSDSCAGCFADISKYGADNCKMACISNWCSKGCLGCANTPSTKSTLDACAGFQTPEVAPCDGGDEYGEYDTRVVV